MHHNVLVSPLMPTDYLYQHNPLDRHLFPIHEPENHSFVRVTGYCFDCSSPKILIKLRQCCLLFPEQTVEMMPARLLRNRCTISAETALNLADLAAQFQRHTHFADVSKIFATYKKAPDKHLHNLSRVFWGAKVAGFKPVAFWSRMAT